MGKCSGLKGGGHHRKAIDIVNKKRTEKQSIKKEKEAAGKRTLILQEILSGELGSIYKDCDIYLLQQQQDMNDKGGGGSKEEEDGGSSSSRNSNIELCREHFRYENCCNRRCKFSHEYTIADALQNVISGTNNTSNSSSNSNDDIDNSSITTTTIPALQFISIDGERQQKRRHRSRLVRPPTSIEHNANIVEDGISSLQLDDNHTPSPLENASIVNTIITYIQSNQDVLNLALSCRYIHQTILLEEGNIINDGCPDVTRRKRQVKECQLDERNNTLLANSKAIGGRLRYIVGYVQGIRAAKSSKKKGNNNNNKKSNKNRNETSCVAQQQRRPVLIYDYENPNIFAAFRESALVVVAAQKKNRVESQNDVS